MACQRLEAQKNTKVDGFKKALAWFPAIYAFGLLYYQLFIHGVIFLIFEPTTSNKEVVTSLLQVETALIGLLTIGVAIFQGSNRWREDLAEKLEQLRKELKEKPVVEAIEQEISRYKKEELELKNRLFSLSARGAVGYPFAFFMVTLAFASYVIVTNNMDVVLLLGIIGTMSFGLIFLGKTMASVERAALRPEEELLPAFRVAFESGATVERFKLGEQKTVNFLVSNYGKEIAEDSNIMFLFPTQFGVLPAPQYSVARQQPPAKYPGYNAVVFQVPVFYADLHVVFGILLKMPDTPGRYDIPIAIRARRIGRAEHKVRVEITS